MDDQEARRWALDKAINEAPNGAIWPKVIDNAAMFAAFIIDGTKPEPAKAEGK